MEQTAAVVVRRGGEGVCWVGGQGVVGVRVRVGVRVGVGVRVVVCAAAGRGVLAAAPRSLHLQGLRHGHLVLDGLLVVHPAGGGRHRVRVRGGVLGWGGWEGVQVRLLAGESGRGQGTGARVDGGGRGGAQVVKAGLAEGTDGPRRMLWVRRRQSRFSAVQPRQPGAVEEVRPAHRRPRQASCSRGQQAVNTGIIRPITIQKY